MAAITDVNILVVEDSPTQLAQLQRTLKAKGYEVLPAKDGEEAVELLKTATPALIISDIIMPRLDGFALCAQIKADEKLKALPVLLLTSLDNPKDVIRGLECGADSFIVKPYEEAALVARVEDILLGPSRCAQTDSGSGVEILFAGQKNVTGPSLGTAELTDKAKIFIIDDEAANVRLLEKILSRAGYSNVTMTTDPERVIRMFVDNNPDLLLLDLHMPHLDGHKVLELLRNIVPGDSFVPVIVLTADVTPQAKYRALAGGAIDFLTKPFDTTEVLLRIRNALFTRFLHRQLRNENALLEERVRDRTRLLEESIRELRRRHERVVENVSVVS
jgi:DNA-binding response OmpR family regulator